MGYKITSQPRRNLTESCPAVRSPEMSYLLEALRSLYHYRPTFKNSSERCPNGTKQGLGMSHADRELTGTGSRHAGWYQTDRPRLSSALGLV